MRPTSPHPRSARRMALAIALLAVLLVPGCAAGIERVVEPPRVYLSDVRLAGGGLLAQDLELDLKVDNPNPFALPIDAIAAQLILNGRPMAEATTRGDIDLAAGEGRIVPVRATVSSLELINQIMALGNGGEISYALKGKAYVPLMGSLGIPFERGGSLKIRQGPGGATTLVVDRR